MKISLVNYIFCANNSHVNLLIKSISKLIESAVDLILSDMSKISWSTVVMVGDCSIYASNLTVFISETFENLKIYLLSYNSNSSRTNLFKKDQNGVTTKYYRLICDKFIESFSVKYLESVFTKCRPLGEVGAEQLLLDCHLIKSVILKLFDSSSPNSSSFVKNVNKKISRIERTLKAIMLPANPSLYENFIALFPEDENQLQKSNFIKILELKVKNTTQPT